MAEHASKHQVSACTEHDDLSAVGKPTVTCSECESVFVQNNGVGWSRYRPQAYTMDRANHTGSQSADSITDGSTNKAFTGTEQTKLAGVATGATANSSDATLLNRANHTGTQSADSLTDGSTNKAYTGTEKTKLAGVASGATANDTDANLKNRANHTGTESADVLTDGSTNKAYTAAEKTKLAGVATAATANGADATLLARANHTGTQTASTISDFAATALAARLGTGVFGYSTGAGGTVTQATNKSTAVTLNTLSGQITMNAASMAAGAIVSFTLNNSTILANDVIVANHVLTGTFGPYLITARATANGTAIISVRNTSAGALAEAIQIRFAVIRAVTS